MANTYWIDLCIKTTREHGDRQWAENAEMECDALAARLQKIMARCADLLDEDQFNELDAIARAEGSLRATESPEPQEVVAHGLHGTSVSAEAVRTVGVMQAPPAYAYPITKPKDKA